MEQHKTLRPDSKGRIMLGSLCKDVSGFKMSVDKHHRITLEPLVEIPAVEKWLFDNPKRLKQIQRGIKDAAEGKTVSHDFSMYLDE